jgi:hypothetical protein
MEVKRDALLTPEDEECRFVAPRGKRDVLLTEGGKVSHRATSPAPLAEDTLPDRIPRWSISLGIDWANGRFAESFFAMFNNGAELR